MPQIASIFRSIFALIQELCFHQCKYGLYSLSFLALLLFTFHPPRLNTISHSQYLILRPNRHGQLIYHYAEDYKGDGKEKENERKRADDRLSFGREDNALVEGYHDIYHNQPEACGDLKIS